MKRSKVRKDSVRKDCVNTLYAGGRIVCRYCYFHSNNIERMTKSRQNKAVDFLRHIRVVPQSIVSSVDQNTVIVDPAGLPFIQGDVAIDKAGGASGAIYETIGIDGFPAEVIESITAPTDAAWWQYENKASPSSPYVVIHVAGPTQASKERNCVLAYAVGSLHLWASHLPPLGFTLLQLHTGEYVY